MGAPKTFAIRLILSVIFGFLVCRFFFGSTALIRIIGMAAIFIVLSYLFEYVRKRDAG